MTDPRTILYIAAATADARDGAAALERAGDALTVEPVSDVDDVPDRVSAADCVVFAETPTTAEGATLLDVLDACEDTPLILFSDSSYAPTAARSTDGIRGYVRRDTADAVDHLADEIRWVCHGREPADSGRGSDRGAGADGGSVTGDFELTCEIATSTDGDETLERAVEAAAGALGFERCWIVSIEGDAAIPLAASAAVDAVGLNDDVADADDGSLPVVVAHETVGSGEPVLIDDVTGREDVPADGETIAGETVRSVLSAPIDDRRVFQAVAEPAAAFDETDRAVFASLSAVVGATVERHDVAARLREEREELRDERDRLADEREQLRDERDQLVADRERLEASRDRLRSLFESLPLPAMSYAVDDEAVVVDVTDAFEETFGLDRETVRGEPVEPFVDSPNAETDPAALAETLRAGEPRQLARRRETDEGVRDFLVTVAPLEPDGRAEPDDGFDWNDDGTAVWNTDGAGDHWGTGAVGFDDRERDVRGSDGRDVDVQETGVRDGGVPEAGVRDGGAPETDVGDGGASETDVVDDLLETDVRFGTGDGEIHGLVVYRDVTERNRLGRELAATNDRLEEIGSIVGEEARAPLNVARGYLELAEETGDPEDFAEIDEAHEALREYLDHLRALTGRDAVVVETERVTLHDVARRAWVAVETGDASLRFGRNVTLEADTARLRELFEHLLESTVDGGEATPTVTVGATEDGFYVAGCGALDGEGDENPLAGRTAAADGTGFRLGLVERIAAAHGWRVGVAEREDGTAFAFRGVDVRDVEQHG